MEIALGHFSQTLHYYGRRGQNGRYYKVIWERHIRCFARKCHLVARGEKTVLSLEASQLVYTNS